LNELNSSRSGAPLSEAVGADPPTIVKSTLPAIKALLAIAAVRSFSMSLALMVIN
jgi:hypothetical protein